MLGKARPTLVDCSTSLVTPGADEIVTRRDSRRLDRGDAAIVVDGNLRFLAAASDLVDRIVGQGVRRLVDEDGLIKLGFACVRDYARERLGISERQAYELARVEREISGYPLMEAAYRGRRLSRSKVRVLLRALKPEEEGAWVEPAVAMSVRRLTDALKARGVAVGDAAAIPQDASVVEEAEEESEGPRGRWVQCSARAALVAKAEVVQELLSREFGRPVAMGEVFEKCIGDLIGGEGAELLAGEPVEEPVDDDRAGRERQREARLRLQRELEEMHKGWRFLSWEQPLVELGVVLDVGKCRDAWAMDECLQEATRLKQHVGGFLMRLLRTLVDFRLFADMGFSSLGHYCVERLGISKRTAESLVHLQRGFFSFPKVAEAYYRGEINQTQAQLIVDTRQERHEREWIERARSVTARQLEADVRLMKRPGNEQKSLKMWRDGVSLEAQLGAVREAGVQPLPDVGPIRPKLAQMCAGNDPVEDDEWYSFRFWLPDALEGIWRDGLTICSKMYWGRYSTRHQRGIYPPIDVCLEIFLDAFVDEYGPAAMEEIRKHPIFERDSWICSVPICTRRVHLNDHHIIYRSRGGSNQRPNRTTLCRIHHNQGVHEGRMTVTGMAPGNLTWKLGLRPDGSPAMIIDGGRVVRPTVTTVVPREAMPVH